MHATTTVELLDDDAAAQLLTMTLQARSEVVRKGLEYMDRERKCVLDTLDTKHALQRDALEAEKAQLIRTYEHRIENLQSTSRDRVAQLQHAMQTAERVHEGSMASTKAALHEQIHELKSHIADERSSAQTLAMAMVSEYKVQQEAILSQMKDQHARDIERINKQLEEKTLELQVHHESFGYGAACTSGNAAKGHEGEQHVKHLLDTYMPLVKRTYDHSQVNETGKNAVGHAADIGFECNGINVLIEVKNCNNPIRKKEIEKAERDLQEQSTARLLILVSWNSRFQKDDVNERDTTFEIQPNNKLIVFMPHFEKTCKESSGIILATTIATVTASMRALDMQRGTHSDIPCALQQCRNMQTTFIAQVKLANSIRREADSIVKHAETGLHTYIKALMNALDPVETAEPTLADVTFDSSTGDTTPSYESSGDITQLHKSAPKHTTTPRRSKEEMTKAVEVIKEALKTKKLRIEDMVDILASHDDTGYSRLQRKWDALSIRQSLSKRLTAGGCKLLADKTWCIDE